MKKKATMTRILGYLLRFKGKLFLILFLSLMGNLLALAGPEISGTAINFISEGAAAGRMDMPLILRCCVFLLFLYISSSVLSYVVNVSMISLSRKVTYNLRKEMFNRLVTLPVSFFDRNTTGDILSRISYDIDTINASLANDVVQVLTSSVTIAGSLIMMIRICPTLVLIFTVTIPLALVLASYLTKMVQPMFRARSRAAGELNGYVEEMISGQKTLRAYTQEERVIDEMNVQNKKLVDAYYKTDYYASIMGPSTNAINNLALALISIFGAILYLRGQIDIGGISAFVLYSRKFTGPIRELAEIYGELQSSLTAAERVFRGGVICPGLSTGLRALGDRCAQLPQIHLGRPRHAIGTTTQECMLSGSVMGTAVLLDGMTARIEEELGAPATLVLTGGLAKYVAPLCRHPLTYDPELMLKGLALLYELNSRPAHRGDSRRFQPPEGAEQSAERRADKRRRSGRHDGRRDEARRRNAG